MPRLPDTIATYLADFAPKGELIGYWIDKRGDYNVLVVYVRDGETRFNVGAFPPVVGHWGHQLFGGDYDIEGIKHHLAYGLWDAPEEIKERVKTMLNSISRE
ncbi:MAG: hypothetical protein AB1705_02265 [Verrucomicrobiota bacterium]